MLKLSDEALGAVMMALQKSLLEENELYVMNPPVIKLDDEG